MEIIIWIVIILLFLLSFVGVFVPVIPGILTLWAGFIVYHFAIDPEQLTVFFWIAMIVISIILIGSDLLMNYYFIQKFGGSNWSQWIAAIGVFIGVFVYPPFGILIIPFVLVVITEMIQKQSFKQSLKAALGTIVGFLSSGVAKVILQIVMIGWFLLEVLL